LPVVSMKPVGDGRTVLLAEDSPWVRDVVAAMLESLGFEVLQTADGPGALSLYDESASRIDLLVLDMDLPGRTGVACLRELRAKGAATAALLMTGGIGQVSGVDPKPTILRKPFQMDELSREVHRVLGGRFLAERSAPAGGPGR